MTPSAELMFEIGRVLCTEGGEYKVLQTLKDTIEETGMCEKAIGMLRSRYPNTATEVQPQQSSSASVLSTPELPSLTAVPVTEAVVNEDHNDPDWHPQAWSQLTTAQRKNLKRLRDEGYIHCVAANGRVLKSLRSLVHHGLALKEDQKFVLAELGRKFLSFSPN